MREMKDSGIEWIGEIPKEWKKQRLRFLCKINTGNMDTQDNDPEGEYPFFVRSPIVEHSKKYTFDNEAVLMAGDGVGAGKVFHYVMGKYGCHQRVYSMSDFSDVEGKYLYYYLLENFYKKIEESNAKSTVDSVRLPMLKDFYVVFPNKAIQHRIVNYLDEKCDKIDTLIEKQREIIEKLREYKLSVITEAVTKGLNPNVEMKDSKIDWIGYVPKHWSISKLKYLFGAGDDGLIIGPFGSAMKGKTIESGSYKIYNQAHLIQNDFSLNRHFVSKETFEELIHYEVKPGDILFSMMGTIGKCQIMPDGYPKGIMDSHLLKARLNKKIIPSFFHYAYDKDCSNQVIQYLLYISNGTIMNGLNSTILKNVIIALPPINEQREIVEYLDGFVYKIELRIEKVEELVHKLQEYKESLIYEVVTGKKEV